MKHSTQLYIALGTFSFIEQGLVMFSYHYMPKWFFWSAFVLWVLSDLGRAVLYSRATKAEEKVFESFRGSSN